jgi:glyceraldehyde-3-phosphate dehydrogenase (NADP+)
MKLFFKGKWFEGTNPIAVCNPFDGSVVDEVPTATAEQVQEAIEGATQGAQQMRSVSGYDRSLFLRKAANLMLDQIEDLAETISLEEGKTLKESRAETMRAVATMELCAEEAKRIAGEVLPLDGASGTAGKMGWTIKVPCGVVAAITPFNYPLNLVCHKVGPALAAGNSVIIKPASDTPLTSLKLVEILLEAGCPPLGVACLTGGGATVGTALCQDPRIRKISFTGSQTVGESICRMAGMKRVTMELGSNSPLVVLPDADLEKVVSAIAFAGFANAGQVCISAQRVIVDAAIHDDLIKLLPDRISAMRAGNQMEKETDVGPMVRESDAQRVSQWIDEAVASGAQLICGGQRHKAVIQPAVLTGVTRDMKIAKEELFGPAVGILKSTNIESAIEEANHSPYGLSAAIFTQDIDAAMKFAHRVESGNIHINWGPLWRTDMMPYGGLKQSGLGKEGPRYAMEEMMESKAIVIHSDF